MKLTTKLKSLWLDLNQMRLKSLQNRTFSELPQELKNEILKEHISTKVYPNVPSITHGNLLMRSEYPL
jgi:hypothetical protein